MENRKIIVAIDGYSSTGKSSFAKIIAQKMGYVYIDTGALYRAITYFAYTNGFIDNGRNINEEWLKQTIGHIRLCFKTSESDGRCNIYLNGANVERNIRKMEISEKVSQVAALPFVREYVDKILKRYGKERGVVMDGRDIGTVVFPHADVKVFLTADPAEEVTVAWEILRALGLRREGVEVISCPTCGRCKNIAAHAAHLGRKQRICQNGNARGSFDTCRICLVARPSPAGICHNEPGNPAHAPRTCFPEQGVPHTDRITPTPFISD